MARQQIVRVAVALALVTMGSAAAGDAPSRPANLLDERQTEFVDATGGVQPDESYRAVDSIRLTYAGSALWTHVEHMTIEGDYAYCSFRFGLMIVDISDKNNPQLVSRLYMPSKLYGSQVVGDYLYICGGGDDETRVALFTIIDISDVDRPEIAATFELENPAAGINIRVVGNNAFVAGPGLVVVDIHDHANVYLRSHRDYGGAYDLEIVGDTAWITWGSYVRPFDISNPNDPYPIIGYLWTDRACRGLEFANDLIYLANYDSGLTIVDPYGDPPGVITHYPIDDAWSKDLVVRDSLVFLGGPWRETMVVIDVSDPYSPTTISSCGDVAASAVGMCMAGDYVYVARKEDGLYIVDVSDPVNPVERSVFRETDDVIEGIEVRGNIGYLRCSDGIRLMDLSDPENMTILGICDQSVIQCMDLWGNYLYTGGSTRVTAWDVSDPSAPLFVGAYNSSYNYIKGIAATADYLYVTLEHAGFGVLDVSNPESPNLVGSWSHPDYKVDKLAKAGEYVYAGFYSFESLYNGLLVFDVSNPTNPVLKKEIATGGSLNCILARDTMLYFSVNWLGNNWVIDTVYLWSIADPENPAPIAAWKPFLSGLFPRDLHLVGDYLYISSRVYSWPNIWVVDISDPTGLDGVHAVGSFWHQTPPLGIAATSKYVYVSAETGFLALSQNLTSLCGDINGDGGLTIDIADLVYLVDYMFNSGPAPPYFELADLDGDGELTISDLVMLVDYMFTGGPEPPCDET